MAPATIGSASNNERRKRQRVMGIDLLISRPRSAIRFRVEAERVRGDVDRMRRRIVSPFEAGFQRARRRGNARPAPPPSVAGPRNSTGFTVDSY
jgi:hypothetical protein